MENAQIVTLQEPRAIVQAPDLAALLPAWHDHLRLRVQAGELSPDTEAAYTRGARKFFDWLRDQEPDTDAIRRWKKHLLESGARPASINAWLGGLRSFAGWAADQGGIPFNPAQGIRGAKRKGTKKRHVRESLTDAEARRLLSQPDRETFEGARDCALLAVMLFTAARGIELQRADLEDVQTMGGRLVLLVQGKGDTEKSDALILPGPAESAVRDWLAVRGNAPGALFVSASDRSRGGRLSRSALRHIVKGHMAAAGVVGNKTTHSLRHTAITNALKHDTLTRVSKQFARHASVETTMVYVHEVDRFSDPIEDKIDYGE
jgi:site-specific recombinase XerD